MSSQSDTPNAREVEQTTYTYPNASAEIARLKRRLAASNEEIKELSQRKNKKPPTTVTMGRAIRRLVSLYDSLDDLIEAADEHDDVDDDEMELVTSDILDKRQETASRVAAFQILIQVLPSVGKAIEDPEIDLESYLSHLQKGANDARSDDVRRIKEELALWLNAEFRPNPPLNVRCRSDRGLSNDITGRLLCPIEYDWDNEMIRNQIRSGTLDISEDYFLRCFYPYGKGDPENVEKGFLRSGLLVKAYSSIFTSPSSSDCFEDEDEDGSVRKKQRLSSESAHKKATKCNVANILGMDGQVTPRSIAYAAVLLAFNLTDAGYWMESYNLFNFRALYAFIVEFFDGSSGPEAQKRSWSLLKWWTTQIFPHHSNVSKNTRKSRDKLARQRAMRETTPPI